MVAGLEGLAIGVVIKEEMMVQGGTRFREEKDDFSCALKI